MALIMTSSRRATATSPCCLTTLGLLGRRGSPPRSPSARVVFPVENEEIDVIFGGVDTDPDLGGKRCRNRVHDRISCLYIRALKGPSDYSDSIEGRLAAPAYARSPPRWDPASRVGLTRRYGVSLDVDTPFASSPTSLHTSKRWPVDTEPVGVQLNHPTTDAGRSGMSPHAARISPTSSKQVITATLLHDLQRHLEKS